jgi:tRNA dimethylallyltransferase
MKSLPETGPMKFNLFVILGPTASGKTRIAVEVARRVDGEIISADSRQVYRGMDIGTGKDLQEYGSVPYHLIDVANPGEEFSVFDFQRSFFRVFKEIRSRGRMPILVGGTGMYLDAVLRGYELVEVAENPALRAELADSPLSSLAERLKRVNPQLHNTTDLLDRNRLIRAIEIAEYKPEGGKNFSVRPDLGPLVFGIRWARDVLRERITRRLRERLENGMIEEVRDLLRKGVSFETLDFYGLEYRYIGLYLRGKLNRNDMFQKLNSAIHQFAKRQETFFRRMERQGIAIRWVAGDQNAALAIVKEVDFFRQI